MRAIVQRVMKASVSVGDELVSSIEKGLCILVGISRDDNPKDTEYLVRKILNLRVFEDDQDRRWSKSVMDKNYEILCVSQFTLYSVLKGNKPDFHCSMGGEDSQAFYEDFLSRLKKNYKPELIKDGVFGAYMQVNIQNDGPVTITLESPKQEAKPDRRMVKGGKKDQPPKNTSEKNQSEQTASSSATSDSLPQSSDNTINIESPQSEPGTAEEMENLDNKMAAL